MWGQRRAKLKVKTILRCKRTKTELVIFTVQSKKSIHPATITCLLIQGHLIWLSLAQAKYKTRPSQTVQITTSLETHYVCNKDCALSTQSFTSALNNQREKVTQSAIRQPNSQHWYSWKSRYRNHKNAVICSCTHRKWRSFAALVSRSVCLRTALKVFILVWHIARWLNWICMVTVEKQLCHFHFCAGRVLKLHLFSCMCSSGILEDGGKGGHNWQWPKALFHIDS